MKSLLKDEKIRIPIEVNSDWVDRIDTWADTLSMTRNGMMRLLVKLSGPIMEKICRVIPAELRKACAALNDSDLFVGIYTPTQRDPGRDRTGSDEKRRSSHQQAPGHTANDDRRHAQKSGSGQIRTRQARAQAQTTAQARAEINRDRFCHRSAVIPGCARGSGKGSRR